MPLPSRQLPERPSGLGQTSVGGDDHRNDGDHDRNDGDHDRDGGDQNRDDGDRNGAGRDRWVEVGRVVGAFGVGGALKVEPWAGTEASVLNVARQWRLCGRDGLVRDLDVRAVRIRPDALIAELDPAPTREDVLGWKGATLSVRRSAFPPAADDEYYWSDLIGCDVFDTSGRSLGSVTDVQEFGAGPLLRVGGKLLVPFMEPYVVAVAIAAGRIVVDWSEEWS
jgi:16S rRNA processing protein RimM